MATRKTPRALLEVLSQKGKARDDLKKRLASPRSRTKVLQEYGITVPKAALPGRVRIPSAKRIQEALTLIDAMGSTTDGSHVIIMFRFGAFPFVVDGHPVHDAP